jgi:acetoin utilization deacetylase AcuC-like enzyme
MRWFYSEKHELHNPDREVRFGTPTRGFEVARRAQIIAAELTRDVDFERGTLRNFDRAHIDRVHDPSMVNWLEEVWRECRPHSDFDEVIPDVFRHAEFDHTDSAPRAPTDSPMARLGYYSFDTMTPIVEGTYEASRAAVDVALSALEHTLASGEVSYGLCRPPGHHASRSMVGGYCFFNNASITAAELARRLNGPVAVIDVDYHHGNGTQSIFYDRDDVFYASLHGSPDRAFPYYVGYRDEQGVGAGWGWNHNVELAKGCSDREYLDELARVLDLVNQKEVVGAVISLGVDTFVNDPISDLGLTKDAYFAMGRLLAELGVPTVVVQEGGYDQIELGVNVRSFLRGVGQHDDAGDGVGS